MAFERNVFVNCPFDKDYEKILKPIVFCVLFFNLKPQLASLELNSNEPRIDKITSLIKKSKYAIHDLSRVKAREVGEVFRFNMPFELGMDVGCKFFKRGKWLAKECLILEAERYVYQRAISDLSGSDTAIHKDDPLLAIREVRSWLVTKLRLRKAIGPNYIYAHYNKFVADNFKDLVDKRGYSEDDAKNIALIEFIQYMEDWIRKNRPNLRER